MSLPSKEQVREWMQQRQQQRTVPPAPAEVRRQLGWGLNVPAKNTNCDR
jgi:hypothetical protein